jgi:hypothetical protein
MMKLALMKTATGQEDQEGYLYSRRYSGAKKSI